MNYYFEHVIYFDDCFPFFITNIIYIIMKLINFFIYFINLFFVLIYEKKKIFFFYFFYNKPFLFNIFYFYLINIKNSDST